MIGAIALKGVIVSANIYGSCDRITFEAFIINKLVPQLWCMCLRSFGQQYYSQRRRNSSCYWSSGSEGAFSYLLILPNSIKHENLWSKLKSILRRIGARTYQDLDEAIALRALGFAQSPWHFLKFLWTTSVIGLHIVVTAPHPFEKRYTLPLSVFPISPMYWRPTPAVKLPLFLCPESSTIRLNPRLILVWLHLFITPKRRSLILSADLRGIKN